MDREAWRAAIHGVAKSRTWLSDWTELRPLFPSLSPRVCSNSCPLSWCCYVTTSSFASLFSFCSIFPSIRYFFSESDLHIRRLKYWNFSFSFSHSNEYLLLISFRTDWLDPLAVWRTLKSSSASQFKSINCLVLSLLYGPTLTLIRSNLPRVTSGKAIALTVGTSVSKVMSLLFNMLSGFVIAFLPRSKCLLIYLKFHYFYF